MEVTLNCTNSEHESSCSPPAPLSHAALAMRFVVLLQQPSGVAWRGVAQWSSQSVNTTTEHAASGGAAVLIAWRTPLGNYRFQLDIHRPPWTAVRPPQARSSEHSIARALPVCLAVMTVITAARCTALRPAARRSRGGSGGGEGGSNRQCLGPQCLGGGSVRLRQRPSAVRAPGRGEGCV